MTNFEWQLWRHLLRLVVCYSISWLILNGNYDLPIIEPKELSSISWLILNGNYDISQTQRTDTLSISWLILNGNYDITVI